MQKSFRFFMWVGLASILVALIGWGSIILDMADLLERWDGYASILFYFPAGIILLLADQVYIRSRMSRPVLGAVVGFSIFVFLHWVWDLSAELHHENFVGNVFIGPSVLLGEFLMDPIKAYLIQRFGSMRIWIGVLGGTFIGSILFVALGMMYASHSRWWKLLAMVISACYYCFVLLLWCIWLFSSIYALIY